MDPIDLASKFDHTLLKPEANTNDIRQLCDEAIKYGFHSVCINPIWVPNAVNLLKENNTKVCTVIGFPLGASFTLCKLREMDICIQYGAAEIDMVMNIGFFKDGNYKYVSEEITKMVQSSPNTIIKVIIEAGLLDENEIKTASKLVEDSGAHFVKTSTGFSSFGATSKIIKLIKNSTHSTTQIKASGGIKNLKQVMEVLSAGAQRIGASSCVIILEKYIQKLM